MEGASLRPPRACRQSAVTSLSHSELSSRQLKKIHRSPSLESSKDLCQSGKERKSEKKRGNKKRQTASTVPEEGQEQSAGERKTCRCARRPLRHPVYGQPLVKSKRNSQSLSLSASKAALIPLNLSFSLTPRHSTLQSQRTTGTRSHISGCIQLQTDIHHNRVSVPLHPPLRLPLPAMEVLPFPPM